MRQLIRTPGNYWTGFLKGFFGTLAVFALPLAGLLFEARRRPSAQVIGLTLLALFVAAIIVGGVFLMRRFMEAGPYRRALEERRVRPARDVPW